MGEPAHPDFGPPLADGPWAGWSAWTGSEPFEEHAGPFYARRRADGRMECGWRVGPAHLNGAGSVHGGALMTFADYSLFQIAYDELRGLNSVTVSLNGEYLAGAPLGALLVSAGDVVKAGRSLIFVRGLIRSEAEAVFNFSGVLKVRRLKT